MWFMEVKCIDTPIFGDVFRPSRVCLIRKPLTKKTGKSIILVLPTFSQGFGNKLWSFHVVDL